MNANPLLVYLSCWVATLKILVLVSAKTLSPSSLPTAWAFNFSAFNIYIEDKSPIQLHSEA
ncbi:hypothetical protein ACG9XR_21600 [Acinetobacter guillouiae]|uniref:Uncharacterized protein n=1 Tax=Acinetobacter johnsonii SH046 TaxID=575586 RepID=D0SGW8_ACIJO|nr:hypothetical protein HMPREF0016_03091 [Acinetobacter johnsonii SH046]